MSLLFNFPLPDLKMDYRNFTVEDFLADNLFQQWIFACNEQNDAFWKNWMRQNPDKRPIIEQAIEIARNLDFDEKWTIEERLDMWTNIQGAITEIPPAKHSFIRQIHWKSWLSAACFLFLLAAIAMLMQQRNMHNTYTSFGQIKKITLADGSVVTLNANSSLRYDRNFLAGKEREIWVDGEAFFEVKKRVINGKKIPFLVHANDLSVQVLGTAFNVANRHGKVNIALQHGAVEVFDIHNKKNAVILKPGESVSQAGSQNLLLKQKVDVAQYASWKDRVVIFKKKSLRELSEMMKDLYNVEMIIDDPALEAETFTGSFPTDSSYVLFDKLQKMYPLEVIRSGEVYHIR